MKEILFFIGGIIFFNIILPIMDAVSTWMQNIFSLKNAKLQSIAETLTVEPVHAIGFQIPNESEEDEEEEYDG